MRRPFWWDGRSRGQKPGCEARRLSGEPVADAVKAPKVAVVADDLGAVLDREGGEVAVHAV